MHDAIAQTRTRLATREKSIDYYSLSLLEKAGVKGIDRMPVSVKILLESVARQLDGRQITSEHIENISRWNKESGGEIPFKPARVIMQDFTGVPGIVDLAAMRDALAELGGDPQKINPLIPVDLVIDHSVQVDQFGSRYALMHNAEKEFKRNRERYEFLHWAGRSFRNFSVVPPATGIVHQVNLEYIAKVVQIDESGDRPVAYPDTLVGTDSHTTMINSLGVLGWGVGGIEAEAALLGQPLYIGMPEVIGVLLTGRLSEGVTATDLVLHVTQLLRKQGVVEKFVEFHGDGLDSLSLPDRATISNMCPEYGATCALFPVDDVTLQYLRTTGRKPELVELVERYTKEQGMFRVPGDAPPDFSSVVSLDLSTIEPSIAGPRRPQDRMPISRTGEVFRGFVGETRGAARGAAVASSGGKWSLKDGSVVIAAITSCTNTSNPTVMVAAGLLAKNAVEKGLKVPSYVKTSLAPGSRVVTRYLELAGLAPYLDQLGFNVVGYGCTTCIGNSGPLPPEVSSAIKDADLVVASVLSGNRNFEGRIHPEVRANFLTSPPLVVAYALAGSIDTDLTSRPIGKGNDGREVFLRDIWPSNDEVREVVSRKVTPALFEEEYANVHSGNEAWNKVRSSSGSRYGWEPKSTYIKLPPFFLGMKADVPPITAVRQARVLALLGDSVTTDHISPAGIISDNSPAARWLTEHGVQKADFNSYGSRRGNHEVMMRGTLANVRIRNRLVPEVEGGYTLHIPTGEQLSMYDAAMKYRDESVPLIIIAGKDYGMGSSRDWAAKGVSLLGVRAVIAESYERIHRSNLIGMGILPLQFMEGESASSLGLTGKETYDIVKVEEPGGTVRVSARGDGEKAFDVRVRIDSSVELEYYANGGILQTVLRQLAKEA